MSFAVDICSDIGEKTNGQSVQLDQNCILNIFFEIQDRLILQEKNFSPQWSSKCEGILQPVIRLFVKWITMNMIYGIKKGWRVNNCDRHLAGNISHHQFHLVGSVYLIIIWRKFRKNDDGWGRRLQCLNFRGVIRFGNFQPAREIISKRN